MQAVLVGVVLDGVVIILILLLYKLVRRIDLLDFELKDARRRLDALERKPQDSPQGATTGRQHAVKQ